MDDLEVKKILEKYETNQCTAEELAAIDSHYIYLLQTAKLPEGQFDYDSAEKEIWEQVSPRPIRRKLPVYIKYAAAAAVFLIVGTGALYYYQHNKSAQNYIAADASKIPPGSKNATLTLANGKIISLQVQQGEVATDPALELLISNDAKTGTVSINNRSKTGRDNRDMNAEGPIIVRTPTGGQYSLTLPDGTRVYLNAATTLTFPSRFATHKREVSIVGEAYFEVAKNPDQPFLVTTKGQQLKVLGTHFNVSAYANEQLKTTLVEGSVQLTSSSSLQKQLLKPDQQAMLLSNGGFQVEHVDAQDAIAWHKGYFRFRETPLPDAIREICRWYKVSADYTDMPHTPVTATLPNNLNLSDFIEGLKFSNGISIQFNKEERRLSIKK